MKEELDLNILLDNLPFGVSVQTKNREIIYENKKVKEMVGSFLYRQCYNRWHYLENQGEEPCSDCPATVGFQDTESHKIFRRTIDENGNDVYVEIQFIPIFNDEGEFEKYIEIISEINLEDKARVLSQQPLDLVLNQVQVSIIQFGDLGGEVITTDQLNFVKTEDLLDFLVKVTVYIFSGLIQGFDEQEGLFGPLPVLDKTNYEMLAHVFKIENKNALDPRKHGQEPCMLYIFFPRDYFFLFTNRDEIEEFIQGQIEKWENIENITENAREQFVKGLYEVIRKQI